MIKRAVSAGIWYSRADGGEHTALARFGARRKPQNKKAPARVPMKK